MKIKDYIQTGVFAALYFVCVAIGTGIGLLINHSGHMTLAPVGAAFFGATPLVVLMGRVKKFGALSLVGLVMGLFFLLSGHFGFSFVPSLLFAVLADVVCYAGTKQTTCARRFAASIVFAYGNTGPIWMMWLMRDAFVQRLIQKGKTTDYIENILLPFGAKEVLFVVVSILVAATLGTLLASYLFHKHFKKSGLVQE